MGRLRVALIPARGGSKGIPRKNLTLLAGKSLLQWAAEAALESKCFDAVLVSTDDEEIAAEARRCGLDFLGLRPAELAGDTTPMLPVIRHEVQRFEAKKNRDEPVRSVTLLQPTSPLRKAEHIRQAVELFEKNSVDALVSVTKVPHQFHPLSVMEMTSGERLVPYLSQAGEQILRRQDKPICYARNGPAILILERNHLMQKEFYSGSTIGFLMDQVSSIDIDTAEDLEVAEWFISREFAK